MPKCDLCGQEILQNIADMNKIKYNWFCCRCFDKVYKNV